MQNLKTLKKFGILFILGALLAPLGDLAHVLTETTYYPVKYHHLIKIPWWVPIQFGVATILIGIAHHNLFRLKKFSLLECCLSTLSLLFCYCLSGIFPVQPWFSFVVILLLYFVNFHYLCDSPTPTNAKLAYFNNRCLLVLSLIIGFIGSTVEVTLIDNKIFAYKVHQIFEIPIWLPILYMHASITVGSFTHYLENSYN
jgi:hypothetical protein